MFSSIFLDTTAVFSQWSGHQVFENVLLTQPSLAPQLFRPPVWPCLHGCVRSSTVAQVTIPKHLDSLSIPIAQDGSSDSRRYFKAQTSWKPASLGDWLRHDDQEGRLMVLIRGCPPTEHRLLLFLLGSFQMLKTSREVGCVLHLFVQGHSCFL